MSLGDLIASEITALAPLPSPMKLSRYMELCLTHPEFGYYMVRDPFGAGGDFTTAPEISQMFGELIGLWAVAEWQQLGRPAPFVLAELGPGRGTLMTDALRAASVEPAFIDALQLVLCDASPILREHQHAHLARYNPTWIGYLGELPPLPTILIANEFFDALPIDQVRLAPTGWRQRAIDLINGRLGWVESGVDENTIPADIRAAQNPAWLEYSPLSRIIMQQLAAHIAGHTGRALIIDYGYDAPAAQIARGDTLQALHRHQMVDPLESPGAADLTAHVDFHALAQIASASGLAASVNSQGNFLKALGIAQRAQKLSNRATPEQAADIASALNRLTNADAMGELFKVLIVAS